MTHMNPFVYSSFHSSPFRTLLASPLQRNVHANFSQFFFIAFSASSRIRRGNNANSACNEMEKKIVCIKRSLHFQSCIDRCNVRDKYFINDICYNNLKVTTNISLSVVCLDNIELLIHEHSVDLSNPQCQPDAT